MEDLPEESSLASLATDILLFALRLRAKDDPGTPEALRRAVGELLAEFEQRAKALRIDSKDIAEAKFALAAFIDETLLRSQWTGIDAWADNPLQLDYFGTYLAGEEFFDKLEALRANPPAKADLLEVFYLCLVLGFKGKFGVEGAERLEALIRVVHDELESCRTRPLPELSPHWKRAGAVATASVRVPRWMVYTSLGVMALGLILYIVFFVGIRLGADDLRLSEALVSAVSFCGGSFSS